MRIDWCDAWLIRVVFLRPDIEGLGQPYIHRSSDTVTYSAAKVAATIRGKATVASTYTCRCVSFTGVPDRQSLDQPLHSLRLT